MIKLGSTWPSTPLIVDATSVNSLISKVRRGHILQRVCLKTKLKIKKNTVTHMQEGIF